MMNGTEFIMATDGRQYYMESLLKSIIHGYHQLLANKKTYRRSVIHDNIKKIQKSDKAHNEIEDYLCTDLIQNYVQPHLALFGLAHFVVNVGVRETKQNVTVGHLDVKFQVASLKDNGYYAFEAKRLDKNATKQKYYINGGIERFTKRIYYPETNTVVAGMVGFVEIDLIKSKKGRVDLDKIKDALNLRINNSSITTTQELQKYQLLDTIYTDINQFKFTYSSKHLRTDDSQEITIYHLFLDYYDILEN